MKEPITLDQIEVQAVVSREQDPYGQEGFSTLIANVLTTNEEQMALLNRAKQEKTAITVQCGRLEIRGRVFKCSKSFKGFEAVVSLDDIRLVNSI